MVPVQGSVSLASRAQLAPKLYALENFHLSPLMQMWWTCYGHALCRIKGHAIYTHGTIVCSYISVTASGPQLMLCWAWCDIA